MKKVFISHSSKDKEHYVRPLVNRLIRNLGKDRIVYDELTFEAGAKAIEEIRNSLEKTDLFVLLISEHSLTSNWVQQELLWAKTLEDTYFDKQRVLPVIIDESITYLDERIPEWIRDYNLKIMKSPSKLSRIIFSRINEIVWEHSKYIEEKNNLFVGRNSEMENFENRINDFSVEKTNFIIASGMPTVGRRTFLKKALEKTGIIKKSYFSPFILLDGHQSIEDFIKELCNLLDKKEEVNLLTMPLESKIDLAFDLLFELNTVVEDKLFIDDQGAIVNHTGEISNWFINLIEKYRDSDYIDISVCIISKFKPFNIHDLKTVFHIHVDVLSPSDRNKLLFQYSQLNELVLDKSELSDISSRFSGFPQEIFYAIDIILKNSKKYFYDNIHIIEDYADDKIRSIIDGFQFDESDRKILKIISKFNFINLESLNSILGYAKLTNGLSKIEKYMRHGLLNKVGVDGEYITLNLAARNYYERQIHLEATLEDALEKFVKSIDLSEGTIDLGDEMFVMQEKLRKGKDVPQDKLIPSYYLKTMKNLYDNRKDNSVVDLANIILESSDVLDSYIREEIRFFLCSSLARLKDIRFLSEVQSISGYKHNFLFGFYYRQIGDFKKAIDKFNLVISENRNYAQAKRELVLLYNKIGDYGKAYAMARDNYENNKNNPYHVHAYFQSVLYQKEEQLPIERKRVILEELLKDFEKIDSPNARNMFLISKAKYKMETDVDLQKVQEIIDQAKSEFPIDNVYLLLFQIDYYERIQDLVQMEIVLNQMKKSGFNKPRSNYYNDYIKCQIFIDALKNNGIEWRLHLSKLTISEGAKQNIEDRAYKLMCRGN